MELMDVFLYATVFIIVFVFIVQIFMNKRYKDDTDSVKNTIEEVRIIKDKNVSSKQEKLYVLAAEFLMGKDIGLGPGRYITIRYGKGIPKEWISNSQKYFSYKCEDELVLAFVDPSIARKGKWGIVVTSKGIYSRLIDTKDLTTKISS